MIEQALPGGKPPAKLNPEVAAKLPQLPFGDKMPLLAHRFPPFGYAPHEHTGHLQFEA